MTRRILPINNRQFTIIIGLTLLYLMFICWVTLDYWVYLINLLSFKHNTVGFTQPNFDKLALQAFLLSILYLLCIGLTFSNERIVIGAWLTTLYVVCVSLVVFSLSTHLFQKRINSLEIKAANSLTKSSFTPHECNTKKINWLVTGVQTIDCIPKKGHSDESISYYNSAEVAQLFDVWKGQNYLLAKGEKHQENADKIQLQLNTLLAKKQKSNQDSSDDKIKSLEDDRLVEQTTSDFYVKKVADEKEVADDPENTALAEINEQIEQVNEKINEINKLESTSKTSITITPGQTPHDSAGDVDAPRNTVHAQTNEQAEKKIKNKNKNKNKNTLKELEKELEQLKFDKGDLENSSITKTPGRTPRTILFTEIESFEEFFWIFSQVFGIHYYWKVPQPILNINLVLCMGVLGSLIFVSIEFMKPPKENTKNDPPKANYSMYLMRPFLGMIIALAMYVMVNSGLSTFLESTEEKLSPFLLSFLGIISGMLAEKAYQRLADTGSKAMGIKSNDKNKETHDKGDKT